VRRTLSKRFGVSPIPVTEALFRLEQDGLVESEPMYGARVRPLTVETVQSDQVLREAIECQAARLCAQHCTETELKDLAVEARALDALVGRAGPRSRKGMDTHFNFHMAIARLTRCPALEQALERVWFRRLMQIGWVQSVIFRPPKDWHRTLVKALATRDMDRAEACMRHHVQYNGDKYLAAMERLKRKPALRVAARRKAPTRAGKKATA